MDGKAIGTGLFAATTHDPEQIIFQNGAHKVNYVGEFLLSMRGKKDMEMAQDLFVLGERIVIQMMVLTHLWWIVLIQEGSCTC